MTFQSALIMRSLGAIEHFAPHAYSDKCGIFANVTSRFTQ